MAKVSLSDGVMVLHSSAKAKLKSSKTNPVAEKPLVEATPTSTETTETDNNKLGGLELFNLGFKKERVQNTFLNLQFGRTLLLVELPLLQLAH